MVRQLRNDESRCSADHAARLPGWLLTLVSTAVRPATRAFGQPGGCQNEIRAGGMRDDRTEIIGYDRIRRTRSTSTEAVSALIQNVMANFHCSENFTVVVVELGLRQWCNPALVVFASIPLH